MICTQDKELEWTVLVVSVNILPNELGFNFLNKERRFLM